MIFTKPYYVGTLHCISQIYFRRSNKAQENEPIKMKSETRMEHIYRSGDGMSGQSSYFICLKMADADNAPCHTSKTDVYITAVFMRNDLLGSSEFASYNMLD